MKEIPMLEKFAAQSLVEHDGELIFSKEKFAELIAKECAGICDALQDIPATEPRHCAEDIRIHFGVK